jgi:hypothetical protein
MLDRRQHGGGAPRRQARVPAHLDVLGGQQQAQTPAAAQCAAVGPASTSRAVVLPGHDAALFLRPALPAQHAVLTVAVIDDAVFVVIQEQALLCIGIRSSLPGGEELSRGVGNPRRGQAATTVLQPLLLPRRRRCVGSAPPQLVLQLLQPLHVRAQISDRDVPGAVAPQQPPDVILDSVGRASWAELVASARWPCARPGHGRVVRSAVPS